MIAPGIGGVDGAGSRPTICAGVIPPTRVKNIREETGATPDNHLTTGPHCGVTLSRVWRCGICGCPTIRVRIVSPTRVQIDEIEIIKATPDDHQTARPDCCVSLSGVRCISCAGSSPAIRV